MKMFQFCLKYHKIKVNIESHISFRFSSFQEHDVRHYFLRFTNTINAL